VEKDEDELRYGGGTGYRFVHPATTGEFGTNLIWSKIESINILYV
jgi:hypothetical protein